jgi:hypothetical protein
MPELTQLEPELGQLQIVEADPNSPTKKPESRKKDGIPKTPIEITAAFKAGYYNKRIKAPPAAALDESESLESGQVETHKSYKANQASNNIKQNLNPEKKQIQRSSRSREAALSEPTQNPLPTRKQNNQRVKTGKGQKSKLNRHNF